MTLLTPRTGQATAGDFPILPSPIDWLNPLARGLVGFWAGLPGSVGGSRLIDWTDPGPNGNHGTLTNMDPATDWVPSPYGWALDFPDNVDRVNVPSSPLFALDDFSVVLWARRDGWFGSFSRFFEITSFDLGCSITRSVITDGIQLWVNNVAASTTVAFPDLTWTCLAVTRRGTTGKIYYNGKDVTTSSTCGSGTLTAGILTIGNRPVLNQPFLGQIASVILYRKELAPSEIQDLYTNPHALLQPHSRIPVLPAVGVGNPWYTYAQQT